jgi:regulator of protease activity HflC (stomatin/prohibitin superfamily)
MNTPPVPPVTGGAVAQATSLGLRFLFILGLIGTVAWLASGIRRVEPGTWAVVSRFGEIVRDQGPGLLLAWPAPFEVVTVTPGPGEQIAQPVLGLALKDGVPVQPGIDHRRDGGYILSGDAGVAHVQATVVYAVVDARSWMVMRERIAPALERLTTAAIVAACARRRLEGVLVAHLESGNGLPSAATVDHQAQTQRETLRQDVASLVERGARELGLGLSISRVDLTVALPTSARAAFANVTTAESAAATEIAQARTAAERTAQEARSAADRMRAEAQSRAREVVAKARVATTALSTALAERDPVRRGLLIERLWHERVTAIVRKAGPLVALDPHAPPMALPGR